MPFSSPLSSTLDPVASSPRRRRGRLLAFAPPARGLLGRATSPPDADEFEPLDPLTLRLVEAVAVDACLRSTPRSPAPRRGVLNLAPQQLRHQELLTARSRPSASCVRRPHRRGHRGRGLRRRREHHRRVAVGCRAGGVARTLACRRLSAPATRSVAAPQGVRLRRGAHQTASSCKGRPRGPDVRRVTAPWPWRWPTRSARSPSREGVEISRSRPTCSRAWHRLQGPLRSCPMAVDDLLGWLEGTDDDHPTHDAAAAVVERFLSRPSWTGDRVRSGEVVDRAPDQGGSRLTSYDVIARTGTAGTSVGAGRRAGASRWSTAPASSPPASSSSSRCSHWLRPTTATASVPLR